MKYEDPVEILKKIEEEKREERDLFVGLVIALVFFAVLFLLFMGCMKVLESRTNRELEKMSVNQTEEREPTYEDSAWIYAQEFVKRALKSPRSAKFEFGAVAKGSVKYLGNDTYSVDSYVDAENSFGASIRTYFSLKVQSREDGWYLVGDIDFSE